MKHTLIAVIAILLFSCGMRCSEFSTPKREFQIGEIVGHKIMKHNMLVLGYNSSGAAVKVRLENGVVLWVNPFELTH